MTKCKSVEEAKLRLIPEIDKAIATTGVWSQVTSPLEYEAGYDTMIHFALQWLNRHCPQGWHMEYTPRISGCTLWTVTQE